MPSEGLLDFVRAAAFHARGRAYDELGDIDAAVADLTTARDLEPRSLQRWIFSAQLAESREEDSARELLGTAIEVAEAVGERSVIPQSRWELAHLELVRGDRDGARREFAGDHGGRGDRRRGVRCVRRARARRARHRGRATRTPPRSGTRTCARWRR